MKAATLIAAPRGLAGLFQSTPPVKAATKLSYLAIRGEGISIHAAREGGDQEAINSSVKTKISIHAAREGGDVGGLLLNLILLDFNPRRP